MKKKTNKWAARLTAFLLAGAVALGSAAAIPSTVQATGAKNPLINEENRNTGTLTIVKHGATEETILEGVEFSVYKIISLTPGDKAGTYAVYTKENAFAEVLKNVSADELGNYSSAQIENLINSLKSTIDTKKIAADDTQKTNANGQAVFENLDFGYYLVIETEALDGYVAGRPFLIAIPSTDNYNDADAAGTTWVYDVTAEPKNAQVSVDKKLAEAEEGAEQDGSVKVGDYVKYVVTTTIPNYTDEYFEGETPVIFTLTDKMSAGLEIVSDDAEYPITVKVDNATVDEEAGTYSVTTKSKEDIKGDDTLNDLTVEFKKDYIKAHKGKAVELTYYAEVTADAVAGEAGNTNKVTLTYNHQPGQTSKAESTEVKVYSFNINVVKFTTVAGTETALAGAKFEIYGDAALTEKIGGELTTDTNGSLSFAKLDEGTYYLKETEAPKGYTLLANPIKVEITAKEDNNGIATGGFTLKINDKEITAKEGSYTSYQDQATGTAYVAVENYKGFSLPATGGMGVTIFLLTGVVGILVLSVMMTRKTRKNA